MPIDLSFEHTPNFRDVAQTGLLLMQRPLVRPMARLRRLREGFAAGETLPATRPKPLRRSPTAGSLY
jgi:hypothetical protein